MNMVTLVNRKLTNKLVIRYDLQKANSVLDCIIEIQCLV